MRHANLSAKKKSRCDAVRPRCANCKIRNISCSYGPPGYHFPRVNHLDHTRQQAANLGQRPLSSETPTSKPFRTNLRGVEVQSRRFHHGGNNTDECAGFDSIPSITDEDDIVTSIDPQTQASYPFNHAGNLSSENNHHRDSKRSYDILAADESDAPQSHYKGSSTFPSLTLFSRNESEPTHNPQRTLGTTPSSIELPSLYGLTNNPSIHASLFELPDRALANSLVDSYFKRTHKLYPFLHEGIFRADYESQWARSPSGQSSRLSWFGLLNMVFVHGCQCCDAVPQDQVPVYTTSFISQAKNIIVSQVLMPGTLETVQSLLLICYYLQGTIDLHECWNLVGLMMWTATSLGLHLQSVRDDIPPVEEEMRKRSWWGCFVLNCTLSMKFGRPPLLRTEESSVDFPLAVDDQYIINDSFTSRQPNDTPSFVSYFVTIIKLAHIVHDMLEELYRRTSRTLEPDTSQRGRTQQSPCSRVLSKITTLDGQLQVWSTTVPRHLAEQPSEGEQCWVEFRGQQVALSIR